MPLPKVTENVFKAKKKNDCRHMCISREVRQALLSKNRKQQIIKWFS